MGTFRRVPGFKIVWDAIAELATWRSAVLALAAGRNKVNTPPGVANGTTNGRFQHTNSLTFEIGGVMYSKSATDNAWNLSGVDACDADQWHAVALCINAAGTYSIVEGNYSEVSAADALATCLASIGSNVAVAGVFVGGNSCDFTAALSAQGTVHQGRPLATVATPDAITLTTP